MAVLSVFVASMILLIFSPGLLSLFLGWDGLGLTSFLLVIYYSNFKSFKSGILTFITNRLGDAFLLRGLVCGLLSKRFNTFLRSVSMLIERWFILIILGCFTKRAQIPFSAWLPAAIAAPTPVSSLVHSSTLVTAGVYIRFRMVDYFCINLLNMVFIAGGLTMLIARLRALTEVDLKKIVALSTLSQLGLIFMALGSNQYLLRFFHLIVHAFFKALIFLATGLIIYIRGSNQNLKIIGFSSYSPILAGVIISCNLRLCGLPFISGFFRKEFILEVGIIFGNFSLLIYFISVLRLINTQIYSLRFLIKIFVMFNKYRSLNNYRRIDPLRISALIILILPACLAGRWIRIFLKLNIIFYMDARFLKLILLITVILRALKAFILAGARINLPKYWPIFNIWFLPNLSDPGLSALLKILEENNKIFLLNLSEEIVVHSLKIFSLKTTLFYSWGLTNFLRFLTIVILLPLLAQL